MEPALFDQADARERGRAHGELWRDEIHALTEIRLALAVRYGKVHDRAQALALAGLHLPVLERETPELHRELVGIAEGANLDLERLVLLNHYADLRDLSPALLGTEHGSGDADPREDSDPGGCTAIYLNGLQGPVLGQTWDTHASAEPFVRMMRIKPRGSETEILCFTLTGCLGMAGLGRVGITINNLQSTDGRIGLLWPAVVRAMLAEPTARAAYDRLLRTPLSSGRHFMIADGRDFFGVECSGALKVLTQKGPKAAHLHTNHCFDPVLRQREHVDRGSTTFARLNMATMLFAERRPTTAAGLWALLSSHEGHPRSICHHTGDERDPDASQTCGVLVMRLFAGELMVTRGCGQARAPLVLALSR